MTIPSKAENPDGLHRRYSVNKVGGGGDPSAAYFVLRLDNFGSDPEHIAACRAAARTYAAQAPAHLQKVADELVDLVNYFDSGQT